MKKNIFDVKELDKQEMNAIQGGRGPKPKNVEPEVIPDEPTPL